MTRVLLLLSAASVALAACAAPPPSRGPDAPNIYRISPMQAGRVQIRMMDAVNALRQAGGLTPVQLDARLNAAAETHARDMAIQNRPWHFGSDGSSPIDRVARVGYGQMLLGENISETFETELETLAAWMEEPATRDVIMNPTARDLGFAWFQEDGGKIWWTLVMGGGAPQDTSGFPQG